LTVLEVSTCAAVLWKSLDRWNSVGTWTSEDATVEAGRPCLLLIDSKEEVQIRDES
jgi:hypothetical protein